MQGDNIKLILADAIKRSEEFEDIGEAYEYLSEKIYAIIDNITNNAITKSGIDSEYTAAELNVASKLLNTEFGRQVNKYVGPEDDAINIVLDATLDQLIKDKKEYVVELFNQHMIAIDADYVQSARLALSARANHELAKMIANKQLTFNRVQNIIQHNSRNYLLSPEYMTILAQAINPTLDNKEAQETGMNFYSYLIGKQNA